MERVCGVPRLRYAPFVTRIGNLLGVCSDAKSFGMEAYAVRFGVDGVGAPAKRLFAAFVVRSRARLVRLCVCSCVCETEFVCGCVCVSACVRVL